MILIAWYSLSSILIEFFLRCCCLHVVFRDNINYSFISYILVLLPNFFYIRIYCNVRMKIKKKKNYQHKSEIKKRKLEVCCIYKSVVVFVFI